MLVAMSGGVDSSVAAYLLHGEGYEVVGVTMKTWDWSVSACSTDGRKIGCCSVDDIEDARMVCERLGVAHYVLDIREEFRRWVIEDFVKEYLRGRTPNPCILCNTHVKWGILLRYAERLGCDYIATGHYARIRKEDDRYVLSRGVDRGKDQSYVLWGLTQEVLARTIFPLGNLTKKQVRQIAAQAGLDWLAGKPDSYEICFIPENDYRAFLRRHVPQVNTLRGGRLVHVDGRVLGIHEGYPFYTIGQRRGLGVAVGKPLYVVDIDPQSNTVVVGEREHLYRRRMQVGQVNWIKYEGVPAGFRSVVKVRYNHGGAEATLYPREDGTVEVVFDEGVAAITPGQSAVFYEGDDVVGGGIIERVERDQ